MLDVQILICLDVRTYFLRLFRPPFQRWRSTRSGAGTGRVALYSPFLLLAFLCGSFRQRKAAKWFCYQNDYNAFSFEARGPKEKALQKENAVFCAHAAQASAFEKAEQNNSFS